VIKRGMQLKLTGIIEEGLKTKQAGTKEPAFLKEDRKIKDMVMPLKVKAKEEEENLSFPTFDIDPEKKKKLNIFKIGSLWRFKYFFDDKEIFKDLLDYYNQEKYQFELGTVGERNKIIKYLEKKGFKTVLVEDASDYTVKVDRFKKYAAILKNSIDYDEKGQDRIFIMKDLVSVEEAIAKGAEKVV
jgi:hypothetical protein